MHTPSITRRLETLASAIAEGSRPAEGPIAIGVVPCPAGIELALRDVPGDPAAFLRGFRAPPDWGAFGILAPATIHHLGPEGRSRPRADATITHLVDRTGASTTVIDRGDEMSTLSSGGPPEPPSGRLADACRRVLGLPTPPPDEPVRLLVALTWLDTVVDLVTSDPSRPAGLEALDAGFGSAAALLGLQVGAGGFRDWDAGQTPSWAQLRRRSARGHGPPGIEVETATWADEGCFARVALEQFPELADLVAALDELLSADAARRVRAVLSGWRLAVPIARWTDDRSD